MRIATPRIFITFMATLIFRAVNSFTDKKNFKNLLVLNVYLRSTVGKGRMYPAPFPSLDKLEFIGVKILLVIFE